jgi:hypothetical protein
MKVILTLALTVISGPSRVFAQSACAPFTEAIEYSLKMIAFERAHTVGDNSAPRATLTAIEVSNWLKRLEINLMLMKESKCPLPTEPIPLSAYVLDALNCSIQQAKGIANAPECDDSKWARSGTSGQPPEPSAEVTLSPDGAILAPGRGLQMHVGYNNVGETAWTWRSSNPHVASVTTEGLVQGLKRGDARIQACGQHRTALCAEVTVMVR